MNRRQEKAMWAHYKENQKRRRDYESGKLDVSPWLNVDAYKLSGEDKIIRSRLGLPSNESYDQKMEREAEGMMTREEELEKFARDKADNS